MPPTVEAAEHVRFLVCCIKYAKDGKVDFQGVADEFGITSKPAAAKRYERLLKSYEVTKPTIPASTDPTTPAKTSTKKDTETSKDTATSGRKRSRAAANTDATPKKKPRGRVLKSKAMVKDYTSEEDEGDGEAKVVVKLEPKDDKSAPTSELNEADENETKFKVEPNEEDSMEEGTNEDDTNEDDTNEDDTNEDGTQDHASAKNTDADSDIE